MQESLSFAVVVLVASIPLAVEIVTTTTLAMGSRSEFSSSVHSKPRPRFHLIEASLASVYCGRVLFGSPWAPGPCAPDHAMEAWFTPSRPHPRQWRRSSPPLSFQTTPDPRPTKLSTQVAEGAPPA
jgi:hypothetical protein